MSIKYFIFYIIFVCGYHYYFDMKIIRYQHSVIKAEGMGAVYFKEGCSEGEKQKV